MFQGDVEQIAAQSPVELSRMFEEVSGSIQYKKEYEELKEKIEKLSKSATESIKNRRRIHGELKTYKEGINKNEEYRKQLDKKMNYRSSRLYGSYIIWSNKRGANGQAVRIKL